MTYNEAWKKLEKVTRKCVTDGTKSNMTYKQYLNYLKKENINAPEWVKLWTKEMLKEKHE